MTGSFKTSSPINIIYLLLYAILLKLYSFLNPHIPVPQATDGFLYHKFLAVISPAGTAAPIIYPLIVLVLTLSQAFSFNRIFNNEKLLSRPSYLPAMAYILATALFPEWWQLSSTLIINTLLIGVLGILYKLFNSNNPKTLVFNAGMIVGIASFFYFPAIGFTLLIFFGLMILRPFSLSEWMVSILGVLTPYYFLFCILFLMNNWNPLTYLPSISVSIPKFQQDLWAWGGMALLIISFLLGGFYIQKYISRMLVHVRKDWYLLLIFLMITLLIPFINFSSTFEYWILCALPFAGFHASAYSYSEKKWIGLTIHFLTIAFIVALNVWLASMSK